MRIIANSEFGSHSIDPEGGAASGGLAQLATADLLARGLTTGSGPGYAEAQGLAFGEREQTTVHASPPRSVRRKWDHFRFDPVFARRLVKVLGPILKLYFRGEVRGVENFTARQSMLVANHDGGMLPI